MISNYKLNARVYPALISLLPILLLAMYFSIDYQSIIAALSGVGVIVILQFVLGELGRDRGKKFEKKLWRDWGGAPSTQILRFSDNTIGKHRKIAIHKKLADITSIGTRDMFVLESESPAEADEIYSAWSNYLRGKTRDTSSFKLLFQENISYGFRRNLWGLKRPAILILIASFLVVLFKEYSVMRISTFSLSLNSVIFLSLLLILLMFWVFIVNQSWIKTVGFAYAERLVECTDNID